MVAAPRWHHSLGMIWDSNFYPFRGKPNHFRKDNRYFRGAARTAPVRYPGGASAVVKEEAETSLVGLVCCFRALVPCMRACGFVIQCTCVLLQRISDLGNNKSWRKQGSLPGAQSVGGRAGCCAG